MTTTENPVEKEKSKQRFELWQDIAIINSMYGGEKAPKMEKTASYIGRTNNDIISRIRKLNEIAAIYGVEVAELPKVAVIHGRIALQSKPWTPEELKKLEQFVNAGEEDLRAISIIFQRPKNTIKATILKQGFDLSKVKGQAPVKEELARSCCPNFESNKPEEKPQEQKPAGGQTTLPGPDPGNAMPQDEADLLMERIKETNKHLGDISSALFALLSLQRDQFNLLKNSNLLKQKRL